MRVLLVLLPLIGAGCGTDEEPAQQQAPIPLRSDGGQAYRLAGRVVESEGRALAGVRVGLVEGHMDQIWGDSYETTTDAEGAFAFDGVMMGNCKVSASLLGYAGVYLDVPSGEGGLTLTLYRAASVTGVVVDSEGRPARAEMLKIFQGPMHPGNDYDWDEIDASGRFHYGGLPPGEFEIRAVTEDGLEADLVLDLTEGAAHRDVRMQLAPPWRSFVRVRIPGHDTEGLGFGLASDDSWSDPTDGPRGERAGDGILLSYRRPPGSPVTVHVTREGVPVTDLAVRTVASRDARPHVLKLPDLVPVRFEVQAAVRKFSVEVWHADDRLRRSRSNRLSPGCTYDVRFLAKGYLPHEVFGWRPSADNAVLKVTLRKAGSIRGVLVGAPVADAEVVVEGSGYGSKVAEDGTFVIEGVEPGERVVCGNVKYKRVAATRVLAVAGEVVDLGKLVAQPRRRITGRVQDEAGSAVGGAEVIFVTLLRGIGYPADFSDDATTYSHVDGRFDFEVPGVEGFLIVVKKGHGTIPVAAGTNLKIVMPRPAILRATVEDDGSGVTWTCLVRWPDIHPHAVWDVGMFLPHEMEVAPGAVEVTGDFDSWRMGPDPPELVGSRKATAVCVAGKTTEVVFKR